MSKIDLRKDARGRECQVRIPGICNRDRETVVLAHLNNKGMLGAGMGQKPHDMFGAHCCSACHDAYDGRTTTGWLDSEVREMFTDGIFRTQKILLDEGKIGVL